MAAVGTLDGVDDYHQRYGIARRVAEKRVPLFSVLSVMQIPNRTYFILLLLTIFGFGSLLVPRSELQPTVGDLTRIGSYSEQEFGPNQPQRTFKRRLFDRGVTIGDYDRYYDVVVFGDSFALRFGEGHTAWPNHFVDLTSLSVLVLNISRTNLEEVLTSPTFSSDPPKFLIYQTVERYAVKRGKNLRYIDENSIDRPVPTPVDRRLVMVQPKKYPTIEQVRATTMKFLDKLVLQRDLNLRPIEAALGLSKRLVDMLPAVAELPFSSKERRKLLVLSEDSTKRTLTAADVAAAAQGYEILRRAVELNGRTGFELMVFPDKSSVYGPYLEKAAQTPSVISDLHAQVPMVDLYSEFRQALAAGQIDLYMPNDSHTSNAGDRLAAVALLRRMISEKRVRGCVEGNSACREKLATSSSSGTRQR
jgi:hypothetical protein